MIILKPYELIPSANTTRWNTGYLTNNCKTDEWKWKPRWLLIRTYGRQNTLRHIFTVWCWWRMNKYVELDLIYARIKKSQFSFLVYTVAGQITPWKGGAHRIQQHINNENFMERLLMLALSFLVLISNATSITWRNSKRHFYFWISSHLIFVLALLLNIHSRSLPTWTEIITSQDDLEITRRLWHQYKRLWTRNNMFAWKLSGIQMNKCFEIAPFHLETWFLRPRSEFWYEYIWNILWLWKDQTSFFFGPLNYV